MLGFTTPSAVPVARPRHHHRALKRNHLSRGQHHPASRSHRSVSIQHAPEMCQQPLETPLSNAKLWANLSLASPALLSANVVSHDAHLITAVWSQRDVIASRKRIYSTTYTRSADAYVASPPLEIHSVVNATSHYSPSGKRILRFTTSDAAKGAPSLLVEIWNADGGLEKVWKVSDSVHGPVYNDEWFGSVSWSPDETMVVYVADRPPPTADDKQPSDDAQDAWIEPLRHKFSEDARDPFGEGYISRRSPALFIADITAAKSIPASAPTTQKSQHMLFGEPQWSPDGKFIVATMRQPLALDLDDDPEHIRHRPYELGLRYCYNRYAAIVAFDAPVVGADIESMHASMRVISNDAELDDFCCTSPRFSPDGTNIVYVSAPRRFLERSEGNPLPHNTTKVLRGIYVSTDGTFSSPETLIGIPENPSPSEFPGLYLHGLIRNPWLDENTLAFASLWGSIQHILSVSFSRDNGRFIPTEGVLDFVDWNVIAANVFESSKEDLSSANLNLLDISGNTMILSASTPVTPTQVYSLQFADVTGRDGTICRVSVPSERTRALKHLSRGAHVVDLILNKNNVAERFNIDTDADRLHCRFQVTLILPPETEALSPLIVFPHGGPHVSTANGYSQGTAALLSKGFAVMYVNYRGSLGLGQKSLETLPGNVGYQDVDEVVESTHWVLRQKEFCLDSDRVGFLGGSHSGFLGAHTSLYPGLFKRTVLRNPVTNIATMFGATDIPDWCYCEAGVQQKNENGVTMSPDAEQYREMYIRSPVSRVGNKAYWKSKLGQEAVGSPGPTFIQVGGSDRRVPPQQSLEWKRTITEVYGSDIVSIRWYPESGHAIDEVPNGDDASVHALEFFSAI